MPARPITAARDGFGETLILLRAVDRLRGGIQLRSLPIQKIQVCCAVFGEHSGVAALKRGELRVLLIQFRFGLIELIVQEFCGT